MNDLNQAANDYARETAGVDEVKAFIAGAEWFKDRDLKEAIETITYYADLRNWKQSEASHDRITSDESIMSASGIDHGIASVGGSRARRFLAKYKEKK